MSSRCTLKEYETESQCKIDCTENYIGEGICRQDYCNGYCKYQRKKKKVVEAKYTTAGMTRGNKYDVIEENKSINTYKIVLDDGTVGYRHKCSFKEIKK